MSPGLLCQNKNQWHFLKVEPSECFTSSKLSRNGTFVSIEMLIGKQTNQTNCQHLPVQQKTDQFQMHSGFTKTLVRSAFYLTIILLLLCCAAVIVSSATYLSSPVGCHCLRGLHHSTQRLPPKTSRTQQNNKKLRNTGRVQRLCRKTHHCTFLVGH